MLWHTCVYLHKSRCIEVIEVYTCTRTNTRTEIHARTRKHMHIQENTKECQQMHHKNGNYFNLFSFEKHQISIMRRHGRICAYKLVNICGRVAIISLTPQIWPIHKWHLDVNYRRDRYKSGDICGRVTIVETVSPTNVPHPQTHTPTPSLYSYMQFKHSGFSSSTFQFSALGISNLLYSRVATRAASSFACWLSLKCWNSDFTKREVE